MKSSIHAKPEMYEADAELAARVRAAGGYASDQWRYRYLSEALSVQSAFWAAQQALMSDVRKEGEGKRQAKPRRMH